MSPGRNLVGWLNVTPLLLVLIPFFVIPICIVLAVSFVETDGFGGLYPVFTLDNYAMLFRSDLTLRLYAATLKFTLLTLLFT